MSRPKPGDVLAAGLGVLFFVYAIVGLVMDRPAYAVAFFAFGAGVYFGGLLARR